MLRIKNGKDLSKIESLGFDEDPDTYTYWERGIRKIIIYLKDRRIRFNSMSTKCYDILYELISMGYVEKVETPPTKRDKYTQLENRIIELENILKEVQKNV